MVPILTAVAPVIGTLIDRLVPDKQEAEKIKAELDRKAIEIEAAQAIGQIEINRAEAEHPSVFVAGWRPFVGWVCGTGLAYAFVAQPLLTWGSRLAGYEIDAPGLDMGTLMTMTGALLGTAGMRTHEKIKGVARQGPIPLFKG